MKTSQDLILALQNESIQLFARIKKLEAFIDSDEIDTLDKQSRRLLNEQLTIMHQYVRILIDRLGRAVVTELGNDPFADFPNSSDPNVN